jgi:hypothetical protein
VKELQVEMGKKDANGVRKRGRSCVRTDSEMIEGQKDEREAMGE